MHKEIFKTVSPVVTSAINHDALEYKIKNSLIFVVIVHKIIIGPTQARKRSAFTAMNVLTAINLLQRSSSQFLHSSFTVKKFFNNK